MGDSQSKTEALSETLTEGKLEGSSGYRGITRVTSDKKEAFCRHLRETSNVAAACRLIGISRVSAYRHRKQDPEFKSAWDEAVEASYDAMESALFKRATEGLERKVYHKGEECGSYRVYSDTAAIFMLKGARPEKYAPELLAGRQVGGHTDNRVQIMGVSDEQLTRLLAKMMPELGGESRRGPEKDLPPETGDVVDSGEELK